MKAVVTVPVSFDMPAIAAAAGGKVDRTATASRADRTVRLHVTGCTQADLDVAVASYDHLASVKAEEVAKIKRAAYAHIVARVPEWKQANLTARGVEFLDIREAGGALTAGEQAEQNSIKAVWAWVKSVRAYSDGLEADVMLAANGGAARAVLAGAAWPAYSVEG